jgi:nucleotide-binding universal stress UspA family protein
MATQNRQLIVVGYDGSECAQHALDWAEQEAKIRGAAVRLVMAWHVPAMVYAGGFPPMVTPSLDEQTRHASEQLAEGAAERLRSNGLEVEVRVCQAQAADALIEESAKADLLVVGSRGHGGFTGLLLGSASQQCAQHGRCPVVVVR